MGNSPSERRVRYDGKRVGGLEPIEKEAADIKLLRHFYEVETVSMQERVQTFYQQVFSGKSEMLVQVSLSFLPLGAEGALHLAQVLPFCASLRELRLRKTKLGEDGCRYLGLALGWVKGLEVINLEDNEIGPNGACYIASGLEELSRLKELTLHLNGLGPEGTVAFAPCLSVKPNLEILLLDQNHIGKNGLAAVLPYLDASKPALRQLGLGFNQLSSEDVHLLVSGLKGRESLRKLVLAGNNISEQASEWARNEIPAADILFD